MKNMCYSYFKKGITICFYKYYDMTVDPNLRKVILSRPHFKVFKTTSKDKIAGAQKIMNFLMTSTPRNFKYDVQQLMDVDVPDENFDKAFSLYISKN